MHVCIGLYACVNMCVCILKCMYMYVYEYIWIHIHVSDMCVCTYLLFFIVGAGLEVGKSCIVVTTGGKNIMFDCGMHMGYNDERRFPDFSLISKCGDFTQVIDCVIITHL